MTDAWLLRRRTVTVAVAVTTTAVIASGIWFVGTHRNSSAASAEEADREFRQLRARFADQRPLLDMDRRQARPDMTGTKNISQVHTVHTVVFDTRGGQRVVRMELPYWIARGSYGRNGALQWLGQLSFLDDTEFDPEPIRLSWEQIAQHGPGLSVDYRHPSGGQFISWAE